MISLLEGSIAFDMVFAQLWPFLIKARENMGSVLCQTERFSRDMPKMKIHLRMDNCDERPVY